MILYKVSVFMYILTKYLYAEDEVKASLTNAILTSNNLDECYFWANELNHSKTNVSEFLWKLYYDFYFEFNPKFEIYMRKGKHYNTVIRNLFRFQPSDKVFLIRQHFLTYPKHLKLYRGRPPKWCYQYEKKYHQCLIAADKLDYKTLAWYIFNSIDCQLLFQQFVKYFQLSSGVYDYWEQCKYSDKRHFLLAIIIQLLTHPSNIYETSKIILYKYDRTKELEILPRKKLFYNRNYYIRNDIGCYQLSRDSIDNLYDTLWYHWEYYCYNSPYWREIFNQFHGKPCHDSKKILFDNDDLLEDFYEKHGYEPDEQKKETQEKSLVPIPNISWKTWHTNIFNDTPAIDFDEQVKFQI